MLLAEVTAYLETQGVGTRATNLFYGLLPDTPDVCVAVFEYGGLMVEPDLGVNGGTTIRLEFPRIQVVCRGVKDDYDGPRLKAQQIVAILTKVANQNLSGIPYKAIMALQPPFRLRQDNNFRFEFVCNYQIDKAFSAT